jgi:hypothetical protein
VKTAVKNQSFDITLIAWVKDSPNTAPVATATTRSYALAIAMMKLWRKEGFVVEWKEEEEKAAAKNQVYWLSPLGDKDDFGQPIEREFIDGKTILGPWAIMTPTSYRTYGIGRLGQGFGQRYEKRADGKWLKVEG